jgi:hypothetical protein
MQGNTDAALRLKSYHDFFSPFALQHYSTINMNLFTTPPVASTSRISSEPCRGVSSDKPRGKTRSACNRCHAQKLKCVRKAGHDGISCERCLRLKTLCRFSPRAARSAVKLPKQVAVEMVSEDLLSMPAPMPMLTRLPDPSLARVHETDWNLFLGGSTDTDGGGGQSAKHISEQIY